jgi:hypothetical protein
MKSRNYMSLVLVLSGLWTGRGDLQEASHGAAPRETRPDFSGTWSLDRSLSNHPAQANFDALQSGGSQGATTRRRGGFGGVGGGGSGRGGNSGSRRRDTDNGSSTPDERARLAALTDELKQASATLVISHHDPSFVINDAQDHTQFFQTTGGRDDQRVGTATIASTTAWEGERLVTAYELSSRRKLIYTYTLLPKTSQLVLRVRLDATQGPRGNGSELKLVYRRSVLPG